MPHPTVPGPGIAAWLTAIQEYADAQTREGRPAEDVDHEVEEMRALALELDHSALKVTAALLKHCGARFMAVSNTVRGRPSFAPRRFVKFTLLDKILSDLKGSRTSESRVNDHLKLRRGPGSVAPNEPSPAPAFGFALALALARMRSLEFNIP